MPKIKNLRKDNLFVDNQAVSANSPLPSTLATVISKDLDSIRTYPGGEGTIYTGVVAVTTAGARVRMDTQLCNEVLVTADPENTGYIFIGDVTVSSSVYGVKLAAGGYISLNISNVNLLYVDSSVNGEGVSFIAI